MSETAPTLFAITLPGLETVLAEELRALGLPPVEVTPGGVAFEGGWREMYRANLELRCATRVLWRMGAFMAFHPAQLDKRARKFEWGALLDPAVPVRVEVATSRKSKIYHAGAATTRIAGALESAGYTVAQEAPITLKVRIDDNRVTISADTSGEPLHKRGHKAAVGKAPLRETIAAAFLRQCGYTGAEPVIDPMCGSGTFVLEAAEMAAGLQAGRARAYAFEHLRGHDAAAVSALRDMSHRAEPAARFHGSDRDAGVIRMATENADRAGTRDLVTFEQRDMAEVAPLSGAPGLAMVNPPYGARIGNKKLLYAVYARLGEVLRARFSGWRVGLVTSEPSLAKSTGLPFLPDGPPIAHGGLRVRLYRTDALG